MLVVALVWFPLYNGVQRVSLTQQAGHCLLQPAGNTAFGLHATCRGLQMEYWSAVTV
jgi:hypothetical protein